jgi:threonine/homoserine/homoserine lactone efflux protein|tara:strand:+ start:9706 stop:10359 length:654 start_codon:yes stop_codon:yes gene_type:complete
MEIIQNGIVFGIIISFMLGPAFFILIETSIKKGFKSAIFLDIGILISDAIYLLAAFFVAEKINLWLTTNSFVKYIAGSIFIILGVVSIYKNVIQLRLQTTEIKDVKEVEADPSKKIIYPFQLIIKGLGLNAINPGVLIFWIAASTYATNELKLGDFQLLSFFGITLLTMFVVDVFKIYFSSRLKEKLDNKVLSIIGVLIGGLMVFFGLAICLKDIQL